MTTLTEDDLSAALSSVLLKDEVEGLDEDLVAYISGLLATQFAEDISYTISSEKCEEMMEESMIPFLESVGCPSNLVEDAKQIIISKATTSAGNEGPSSKPLSSSSSSNTAPRKLQQGIVNMASTLSEQAADDEESNKLLWGTGGNIVKANANTQIDAYSDKTSAKDKRKQRQELEKARRDLALSNKENEREQTKAGVSAMLLPTVQSKEKDVQLQNITLSLDNGTLLMDHGDLKFTYQRRYGLIGENGVGKVRNDFNVTVVGSASAGTAAFHSLNSFNLSPLCFLVASLLPFSSSCFVDNTIIKNCQLGGFRRFPTSFTCITCTTRAAHRK